MCSVGFAASCGENFVSPDASGAGGSGGEAGSGGGAGGGGGGTGGDGGGGLGCHSFGVAFLSTLAASTQAITAGLPGVGGLGGDIDATLAGGPGVGCKTLDFADAASGTKCFPA